MQHRRHLVLLGSILLAVSMLFAFTPAASTAFADTATFDSVSTSAVGVIVCQASVSLPALAGNTAETVGSISCNAPVSAMSITVSLFRNDVNVKSAVTQNAAKSYIFAIPKYTCPGSHIHTFFGFMAFAVYYPPGYSPPKWVSTTGSGSTPLPC